MGSTEEPLPLKDAAETTISPEKLYTLPKWFMERNVKTAQDLTAIPDQISFCNCDDCKQARLDDEALEGQQQPDKKTDGGEPGEEEPGEEEPGGEEPGGEEPGEEEPGQNPDEMHYKPFSELHDVTYASLMPSRNGRLGPNPTTIFRVNGTSSLEPTWMSQVIVQLAKASKAMSIITFDFETLEELGCEFHHQDQERAERGGSTSTDWEPDMYTFTTFLERFFSIRAKRKASQRSWERGQQVLSTVLDAAQALPATGCSDTGKRDDTDAVLIHIVDCPLIDQVLDYRVKRRVLARLTEMVQARREQGQAMAIVLSTSFYALSPGDKDLRKVGATEGLTVTATINFDVDQRNKARIATINAQRLRRLLRCHAAPNLFCTELLALSSDWSSAYQGQSYESFAERMWSSKHVKRAVTLLMGRGRRISKSRSQMSFTDISLVLERVGLLRQADADGESQAPEEAGEAENEADDDKASVEDNNVEIDDEPSAWPLAISYAGQEWEHQKDEQQQENTALDSLMSLVGLEEAKSQFMAIKNLVDTARRQDADLKQEGFGAVFMGGPGSGKSTVAGLYAKFLSVLGLVPELKFEQTTGARLADGGVSECKAIVKSLEEYDYDEECVKTRGVVFIDGAHNMVHGGINGTFHYLMDEIRRLQGQVVFLFAGPLKQMQSFVGLSPSLRSHVPFTLRFDDFTDGELHRILVQQLQAKFQGKMRVEGGINGVYMRILTRRIGRGRGSGYFANARDVQNALLRVLLRQADRLSRSRRLQEDDDDMFLTQTDLIGPPPVSTLENSAAWKKLQDMTGLASVKQSVRALITRLQTNYDRELAEQSLVESSLNKVFLGSPGTGKTTVAKYYAEILTELGLLSNGEVIVKSCHDFIGNHVGDSESLTKAILDSAQGKVLIIDEAYGLSRDDTYSSAVIDTLVAEVQATSNEDRAVLLLGYKDEMEEMFQKVNPGLGRRFPLSSAFEFQDFSDEELRSILDNKLQAQGFTAAEEAKQVAMEVLRRSRNHRNFGNAGEIDILLDRAKAAQQVRLNETEGGSTSLITELKEVDFDADHDRQDRAESNIQEAFAGFVGAEALVSQFQAYRRIAQNSKDMGLDPREQIPFNFIFRGPPGTGKTTTARKLGQIFFDMGFLATKDVEVCSASELIGQYVGQTGPKTQKLFQKAMGKVLFIDEAYRLADGRFGKESVDEIVNLVTLPKYKNRIVVVLAGYDRDINHLLASNPGFGSRFSEVIEFPSLSPKYCQELLVRLLQDRKLGVSNLRSPLVASMVQAFFQTLSGLPGWGSARDVENLATSLFGSIISAPVSPPCLEVAFELVYEKMKKMIAERKKRAEDAKHLQAGTTRQHIEGAAQQNPQAIPKTPHKILEKAARRQNAGPPPMTPPQTPPEGGGEPGPGRREAGVSDALWRKLEERKAKRKDKIKTGVKSDAEKEEAVQKCLIAAGKCEMGYEWLREEGGFRCAGGSHYMSLQDIWKDFGISMY